MAVSIKKQMTNGLTGLLNYTWAKTEDAGQTSGGASGPNTGGGSFFGTDVILDPFNRKNHYSNAAINMSKEQGRSDLDLRNRFVGSLVYTSTFQSDNKMLKYGLSGWTTAGSLTLSTGVPQTALMSGNPALCPLVSTSGGVTSGCSSLVYAGIDGGATGGADNTNNSTSSALGRAPQVARNGFPGPGIHNFDLRIARDFPIHESISFQIVGEAFNLVNHRNGLGVATTAFSYANPSSATASCPAASHANTCIIPFVSSTPFGTINSTAGTLYGARQLQVGAKLFF
jgi:hypothetical protein